MLNASVSYVNSLVMMDWPHLEVPAMERLFCQFQGVSKITPPLLIPTGSVLAVRAALWSQPSPARGKGSPRRMQRGALYDQGKHVRKWDGDPNFNLEACVHELRRNRAVKKGSAEKSVRLFAAET